MAGDTPVQSPVELKEQIEAEREGTPFLIYRDGDGAQRIFKLSDEVERVTVGRVSSTDIWLEWDTEVSRLHAELGRIGADWTVSDDGLSRNGTHLNGERVVGRRRLRDRDVLRFGQTTAVYREPLTVDVSETEVASEVLDRASLSEAQRRVLVALCRPFKDATGYVTPATNQQIADGAVPERRRGQDPPSGAVRQVRNRGPTPESEAHAAGRAGAEERCHHAARSLGAASVAATVPPVG